MLLFTCILVYTMVLALSIAALVAEGELKTSSNWVKVIFWPMWLMEMCCEFKTKEELIDNLKKWHGCYEKDGNFFIDNAEGPGMFEVVVDNQEYWEFSDGKWHYEIDDPEVLEEFKKGLKILKMAAIYAQRIDWLLSGDDGEDSFKRRLKEELDELESKPLVDYERWFETLKDDADDE